MLTSLTVQTAPQGGGAGGFFGLAILLVFALGVYFLPLIVGSDAATT